VPADPDPDPNPDDEPFIPPVTPSPTAIIPPGRDSAEAIAIEQWANTLGTDRNFESYGFWAREKCNYVPAAWIRALLERKVQGRSGTQRAAIPLLGHILGEWMNAGECPYLKAQPNPGPALPPPTEYHVAPANSRHRRNRGDH
jgi:hypothetical protein